jgi:hypothetical protein
MVQFDLCFLNMCQKVRFMTLYRTNKCKSQVIGLLYQSILSRLSIITAHKKTTLIRLKGWLNLSSPI